MIKAPTDISGGVKPGEEMVSGKIELTWENDGHGTPSEEEIKEIQEYYKECESSVRYHICPFLNTRIKNREEDVNGR